MKLENFRKERNIRDLGGYPTTTGKIVTPNLFYRCAALYFFNEEELKAFKDLNIKTIVDLRSKEEADYYPDPVIEGAAYLQHSCMSDQNEKDVDFSPKGMLQIDDDGDNQFETLKRYYASIPYNNEALRIFFGQIKEKSLPICFHCYTGKDRTGVAAILLLGLLQVDKQTIMDDYLYSNVSFADVIAKRLAKSPIDLQQHPETKRLLEMCYGVDAEVGEAVYEGVLTRYGSFEQYFKEEYGFSDQDINDIRSFATTTKK